VIVLLTGMGKVGRRLVAVKRRRNGYVDERLTSTTLLPSFLTQSCILKGEWVEQLATIVSL